MFSDDSLIGSWPELLARLDGAGTMTRWAVTEPVLAGFAGVADLPAALSKGTDRDRADAVLGGLLRWAALDGGDDPDAVLVLLHSLSDGVLALAARFRGLIGDAPVPVVVAELTCQIRAFRCGRSTRAHAANLLLNTKNALWREFAAHRGDSVEVLVDPHSPGWERHADRDDPAGSPDLDVIDVIRWAARADIASPRDLGILLASERAPAGAPRREVAARFGLHDRALRRRRSRTVQALRAASGRYLQAVA